MYIYIYIYIYIYGLMDDISSKVLKFADDTKVFRKVGKCKCINIGQGNMD